MAWHLRIRARAGAFVLDAEIEGDDEPVAIVGPNGSGKTTLLRVVAGAHRAAEGRIELDGRVLFDSSLGVDVPPERRRVGYVPQGHGLFPHMTAARNVAFAARAGQRGRGAERTSVGQGGRQDSGGRAAARREAAALLERVACGHLANRLPRELSGGESQRVALARALAAAPEILLLDEPLAALDATARHELRSWLAEYLAAWRKPAVVVTHDLPDLRALAPRSVYVLEAGAVAQSGPPGVVAARPRTRFARAFFEPGDGGLMRPTPSRAKPGLTAGEPAVAYRGPSSQGPHRA